VVGTAGILFLSLGSDHVIEAFLDFIIFPFPCCS
jgi:hypothetical protein